MIVNPIIIRHTEEILQKKFIDDDQALNKTFYISHFAVYG